MFKRALHRHWHRGVFKLGHYRNQPSRASFLSSQTNSKAPAPRRILPPREVCAMESTLNKSFSAKLQKSHKGGWTYVVWPNSVRFFETRGLVKVGGTIDGYPFKSSFMAMGDGRHMLPIKAEIRRAIGKEVGKTVKVVLKKRIRDK